MTRAKDATMTIRELRPPSDLLPLADMVKEAVEYPENPEWNHPPDEDDDLAGMVQMLRRIWPLIRLAQCISKPSRDFLRGFVWEENGQIGGAAISQRRASSNTWTIATVAVRPAFRRRGLARKLLARTLDDIRTRGGTHIVLSVIDQNVPAYSLYKDLGFEHYSSQIEYSVTPHGPVEALSPIPGYTETALDRFEWKDSYVLTQRITPVEVGKYAPVEVGQYKKSAIERTIARTVDLMQKQVTRRLVFRKGDEIVGHSGYLTRTSEKGTSSMWVSVDPKHPELARYAVAQALGAVIQINPDLRVLFSAPTWMPALAEAAESLGFTRQLQYHKLGLIL
jgi:ribosomal protein S18 acetylase RimI-like enzyme